MKMREVTRKRLENDIIDTEMREGDTKKNQIDRVVTQVKRLEKNQYERLISHDKS